MVRMRVLGYYFVTVLRDFCDRMDFNSNSRSVTHSIYVKKRGKQKPPDRRSPVRLNFCLPLLCRNTIKSRQLFVCGTSSDLLEAVQSQRFNQVQKISRQASTKSEIRKPDKPRISLTFIGLMIIFQNHKLEASTTYF